MTVPPGDIDQIVKIYEQHENRAPCPFGDGDGLVQPAT